MWTIAFYWTNVFNFGSKKKIKECFIGYSVRDKHETKTANWKTGLFFSIESISCNLLEFFRALDVGATPTDFTCKLIFSRALRVEMVMVAAEGPCRNWEALLHCSAWVLPGRPPRGLPAIAHYVGPGLSSPPCLHPWVSGERWSIRW